MRREVLFTLLVLASSTGCMSYIQQSVRADMSSDVTVLPADGHTHDFLVSVASDFPRLRTAMGNPSAYHQIYFSSVGLHAEVYADASQHKIGKWAMNADGSITHRSSRRTDGPFRLPRPSAFHGRRGHDLPIATVDQGRPAPYQRGGRETLDGPYPPEHRPVLVVRQRGDRRELRRLLRRGLQGRRWRQVLRLPVGRCLLRHQRKVPPGDHRSQHATSLQLSLTGCTSRTPRGTSRSRRERG